MREGREERLNDAFSPLHHRQEKRRKNFTLIFLFLFSLSLQDSNSLANNNGYVPYTEYGREYLPPGANGSHLHHQHQHQLQQQLHIDAGQMSAPQHASIVLTSSRDSYCGDPYGTLVTDPRFSGRAFMTSPAYLRSPVNGVVYGSTSQIQNLAPSGQLSGSSSSHSPSHQFPSHFHHQQPQQQQHHPSQQVSSLGTTYAAASVVGQQHPASSLQMYITSSSSSTGANGQPVKQTTLATHV